MYLNCNIHLLLCTCNNLSHNSSYVLQAKENKICNKNDVANK